MNMRQGSSKSDTVNLGMDVTVPTKTGRYGFSI